MSQLRLEVRSMQPKEQPPVLHGRASLAPFRMQHSWTVLCPIVLKYAGNVLGGQRDGLWNCKSQDCQSALPHHILDSEMSLGNLQVNVVQDEVKG